MKSVAQQLVETQESLIASGKFTAESLKETVKDCVNEEHRLSVLKTLSKKNGITESKKITRNNGSGSVEITESDKNAERVQQTMKDYKCSFREASIISGLPDPGRDAKFPSTVVEALKATWRKSGAMLTEQEIATLAEKGIEP